MNFMTVWQKRIMWLVIFAVLASVNLLVISSYVRKVKRVQASARILDEIEFDSASTSSQGDSGSINKALDFEERLATSDARVANLKRFFRKYNSPLYDHANFVVEMADQNSLDYRLLPAIAMQESGLCSRIPDNSYNCWGWGIYGGKITRFKSYPDAIETISKGLKKNYIDRGMTTASQIMEVYTPSSNGSWAHGVNTFLKLLE
jgi:hypothetical protein